MSGKIRYLGDTTGNGPSGFWAGCPLWESNGGDLGIGYGFFDDFVGAPAGRVAAGAVNGTYGRWDTYRDIGVTISGVAGVGGIVEIAGNDADNDEGHLSCSEGAFLISDTAANSRKLWFEARIKKASIADNALSFFLGLAYDVGNDLSLAKADALVNDTGVLGSFAGIGFSCVAAAGETVNFVYNQDADATITTLISGVHTLVADTYVKLGMLYDPDEVAAKQIKVFVDGAEQTTYGTSTIIATAAFPDAEALAPCFLTKVGAATESKAQMDWIGAYQLR